MFNSISPASFKQFQNKNISFESYGHYKHTFLFDSPFIFHAILKPSCYFLINISKEEGETCLIHAANTWKASTQLLSSSQTTANLRPLLGPFSNGSSFLSLEFTLFFFTLFFSLFYTCTL